MHTMIAAQFTAAVRGIPAHHVAHALNTLTRYVNWTGCTKGHMAEAYAQAVVGGRRDRHDLYGLDLRVLARRATARAQGNPLWARLEAADAAVPTATPAQRLQEIRQGHARALALLAEFGDPALLAQATARAAQREQELMAAHRRALALLQD